MKNLLYQWKLNFGKKIILKNEILKIQEWVTIPKTFILFLLANHTSLLFD